MYERYYDKFQASFGRVVIELQYMDCDSFVLSITTQNNFIDLKFFKHLFGFNNLNKDHKLFSNKNTKVVCKLKIETPEKK